MNVSGVLEGVIALYDGKPERYTKEFYARDEDGNHCLLRSSVEGKPPACWCLLGAIEQVIMNANGGEGWNDLFYEVSEAIQVVLRPKMNIPAGMGCSIAAWNDRPTTTLVDVINLLKETLLCLPPTTPITSPT